MSPTPAGSGGVRLSARPAETSSAGITLYDAVTDIGVVSAKMKALAEFEKDDVVRGAIGEDLAAEFVRLKRMEWIEYCRHVSEWERDRYLEFF